MILQVVQFAGAFLILGAFMLVQFRRTRPEDHSYLAMNFLGAGILTATAWVGAQWGFVLLEGVWSLVSLWGLLRPRRPAP